MQYRIRLLEILRSGVGRHLRDAVARTQRLANCALGPIACEFTDAEQVETTLKNLMSRQDGPFIARLARAPGARESRYAHLFSGTLESAPEPAHEEPQAVSSGPTLGERVNALEQQVEQLRAAIDALKRA